MRSSNSSSDIVADWAKAVVEPTVAGEDPADRAVVLEVTPVVWIGGGADGGVVCSATEMNSKAGGCSCLARGG